MKKLLITGAALALAMSLIACSAKNDGTAIAPEMKEYTSLQEINEIAGTDIFHPGVMGISKESFYVVDEGDFKIAEYNFDINGLYATIRCANTHEDISGLRNNGKPVFTKDDEIVSYGEIKAARWFEGDRQFVFSIVDELSTVTDEDFKAMVDELKTSPTMAGNYQDVTSQRASMTIDDDMNITVTWASSANETTEWKMHATMDDNGKLSYNDCMKKTNDTIEYENGSGFFEIKDGKIEWTGAADENCRACVFEKV